jgi:hypothetical protein
VFVVIFIEHYEVIVQNTQGVAADEYLVGVRGLLVEEELVGLLDGRAWCRMGAGSVDEMLVFDGRY